MTRYLRWRNWWITHTVEINVFKWGFAFGVITMGLAAIVVVAT